VHHVRQWADGIIGPAMTHLLPQGWLPLLDPALRGALLALLVLLALNQWRRHPRLPLDQVGLPLALGLCVQVLAHAPVVEWAPLAWWKAPLVGVAMGNSVLGWLFVRTLCDDDFRPRPHHAAAWVAVAAAGTLNMALLAPWCVAGGPGWASAISQTVFALPLVFGLLTVVAAAAHWRDDLVERRRWLRAVIVVGASVYTLAMVVARRSTADGRLTPTLAAIDAAALLLIVSAVAWLQLRPKRDELPSRPQDRRPQATPQGDPPSTDPPDADIGPADDATDLRLAGALQQAMSVERAYKDPELSVAGLATRLAVPEYRLRRHINRRLGHRNFSAFLNGYRLDEARSALADPSRRHLPVLTIALEAGFGSIGPFNRAFKQATGLTPTDFRRQHIADS
jgi:AraC-like DNA-binding protein